MKKVLWFTAGIAVGIVAAHQLNQTAQGKRFFAELDAKIKDFSDALVDGYHEREDELRSAIGDAGDAVKKAATK
ncbi:hypothetical protein [Subtercola boreus]|uniref:Uncharacterized protein n=1 Tax=Subtercola boreus TaxID=120213 RepID=A0A3E0WD86_9MICO|nr:hypothetical protein [Subtercola boreus]RFA21316.1 hypothetical protein B7R24_08020 [Subtercola boreus]RFA21699.1 hypothetical protein B7R23_07965 [Subtercola boreus]RFA27668.1 hypothetical protein B7R25_08090 [Subtercola boreus]